MLNPVLERFVDRLTDAYNKDENSNVMKLAKLTTEHIQQNQDVYERIQEWQDISKAEGAALDMLGANFRQRRGQLSDVSYRVLIKSKIKRGLSDGSIDTIIDFISFILQIDPKEVLIEEAYPAALNINAPVRPIADTGLTVRQFGTLIDLVVAGGVRANALFEGTFEFAAGPGEIDETKGFADLEQTMGGTLGLSFDPNNDFEIPI